VSIRKLCVALTSLAVAACASTRPEPGQAGFAAAFNQARLDAALALPVCQDSLPVVVADTAGLGIVGPAVTAIVTPPFPVPKALLGTTGEIHVLVNPRGGIDSILAIGIADARYVSKLREGMLAHAKYLPATMNGCRRAGWAMHKVRFDA
jgi:hypothetical protein